MGQLRIVLLCVLWGYVAVGSATASSLGEHPFAISSGPRSQLNATVQYSGPRRTLTLWQIPPGPVKKVLFIAVGSGTYPWDFWDRTPSCPLCRGMPESRKIVLDALDHRYAVVVISPLNVGKAWDAWPKNSTDLLNAVSILSLWKLEHGFGRTPTVALGSSAGGHALSTLGLRGTRLFESMVIMMSKGLREAWGRVRNDFPPTLFVHCPREWGSAKDILKIMSHLRRQGVETNEVGWFAHSITPTWFSQLIPGLDPTISRAIYDVFKEAGWILDENDFLLSDSIDWQTVVRASNILPEDPENPGQLLYAAAIEQEMRVAFAMHSTVSRKDDVIFNWFEGDRDVRPESSTLLSEL